MQSSFLYLIVVSAQYREEEKRSLQQEQREHYREKVWPLCYYLHLCICPHLPMSLCICSSCLIVCSLAQLLPLTPLITQLLPPIPPFPLTCPFLLTTPCPTILPLTPLHLSDTSAHLSACLTTSAHPSDRLTAPAHLSTSAHSYTPWSVLPDWEEAQGLHYDLDLFTIRAVPETLHSRLCNHFRDE